MNKKNKIIFISIMVFTIFAISLCIYFINNKENTILSDAITFRNEYMNYNDKDFLNIYISENNTFKYKSEAEILEILKNGNGIIYIGDSKENNSRNLVNVLSEVGIELEKDIYYINSNNIINTEIYDILETDVIPILIIVKNGSIIATYKSSVEEDNDTIKNELISIINSNEVDVCTKSGC